MAAGGKEMQIAIAIAGKVESSFKSALGAATKGIGGIAKSVAAATTAAAAAVGAIGVAAVKTGAEFEKSMSQVAATMLIDKNTEKGQKSFETLENAARECGANTAFSASEAAEALNYLALAGYDADKAAAALPTVLNLAGAGAMELAQASDMVTDSMSALGIEATQENLTNFADQLAKTASVSNTSVAQLGEGILTVGGTAKDLAGGTTELNTALGILADNGIKASEGGTHLRNMILSLQNARNADAAKMFEEMGLSAYDAEGKMRSLGDIFGDINTQLEGASAEKVNNTLSTIFKQTDLASARAMLAATVGDFQGLTTVMNAALEESGTSVEALGINLEDMAANFDTATTQEEFAAQMMEQFGMSGEQAAVMFTGLQSIVNGTGNRFKDLTKKIEESKGACEDMYAIQQDNLIGDKDKLFSALSDLGISIYKDLNGPLRETTQLATSMVGKLSEAYKSGGMEGMVGAVGGCLSEIVNVIADYAPKVVSMGVDLLGNFISGIMANSGTLADTVAEVISVFADGLFTLMPQVILAGTDIITKFAQSMVEQLPQLIDNGVLAITNFVNGIVQRLPEITSTALQLVQTLANSIGENAPQLINAAILLIGSLAFGLVGMLPQLVQMGMQLIVNIVQGIASNLPQILQMGIQLIINLIQGIVSMIPMLINSGIQLIVSLLEGIVNSLPQILQMGPRIIGELVLGLIKSIPQILTAGPKLVFAICDMVRTTDWPKLGMDIITGIVDGIISLGGSLWDTIKSLFTGKEPPDMSATGSGAALSYANGITSAAPAVSSAASSLTTNAFGGMDFSGASAAGTQAGTAFGSSLAGGMQNMGFDSTAFNNNMNNIGTSGAASLGAGLNSGLAAAGAVDTSGIFASTTFDTEMQAAGQGGATAFGTGMAEGISKIVVDTKDIELDSAGVTEKMTAAGQEGVTALSTGMASNSQAVTQAASLLGNDINTALDSGWNRAKSSAQTAMQQLASTVTSAANSAASAVKSAFANMTITIPKPKIPVISVSTNSVPYGKGGNVSIPKFSVKWNALGGIFDKPTIFNTPAGMQGVGEAGPEAVLPLNTLWAKMKEILNGALAANNSPSIIDAFLERLKGIGNTGGNNTPELAGAGGATFQYSPTYNLYGSIAKQDVIEADQIGQAEFNRLMRQYERDRQRRKL